MSKRSSITDAVEASSFYNRENEFEHLPYEAEMLKFHYLKEGREEAITEFLRYKGCKKTGHLSDDPIQNAIYLFIATTTLTTRFSIEAGLDSEKSYTISDVFIRRADHCKSTEEVHELGLEMFTYFLRSIQSLKQNNAHPKPIIQCINYIETHLHEKITLHSLSEAINLSPSYLSALFKKEMHVNLTEYITIQKIEAAKKLLCFTDYSVSDLATIFSFSSESRFIELFRLHTNTTPKKYRNLYYNQNLT